MKVEVLKNSKELGQAAAEYSAKFLNKVIEEKGNARLVLSTGQSQFDTLEAFVSQDVDWTKVEMFHLDEYVSLSEEHPASFRRYLKERFTEKVPLKKVHFVNGEGNIDNNIDQLTREIRKAPIDVALVGVGENAHIAFNDPPADFKTKDAYITVNLDEDCKQQQVREGWFPSTEDVPSKAITMTVHQILDSHVIVSAVPYESKAKAVKATLENQETNEIPATALKSHEHVTVFLDHESASLVDKKVLMSFE